MFVLEDLPPNAEVTVAIAPGRRVPLGGTRVAMERDGGELCQAAEVTLVPAGVVNGEDPEIAG